MQVPLAVEPLPFVPLTTQISAEAPDTCWTRWALVGLGALPSAHLCQCAPVAQRTGTAQGVCGPRCGRAGDNRGLLAGRGRVDIKGASGWNWGRRRVPRSSRQSSWPGSWPAFPGGLPQQGRCGGLGLEGLSVPATPPVLWPGTLAELRCLWKAVPGFSARLSSRCASLEPLVRVCRTAPLRQRSPTYLAPGTGASLRIQCLLI